MTQTDPNTIPQKIDYKKNNYNNHFLRKLKEEPLIPFGLTLTVLALAGATLGYQKGDSKTMQRFLRFRVLAQGFTVVAAVGVPAYYQLTHKRI
ncbi:hypoxia induced protein conserved region-domain-containing protein [Gigaspora rosea]|uniref:Hypoxia induced protein conserved region-domain-containing protein n=1 Tax=Gigaspora rosea TaxID=44941 RepID=A0A397UCL7_9GLOM|nr:hypoxia induced protein conserved region-domain-containing protein [Gigaspora rosea]